MRQLITIFLIQTAYSAARRVGEVVGRLFAFVTMMMMIGLIVVGLFFLIRYIIRKSSGKKNIPDPVQKENIAAITTTVVCNNCSTKNAADARFCKGCGYEITKK